MSVTDMDCHPGATINNGNGVTDEKTASGGPINSGNANWEPRNDCRISSSNKAIEDMTTEELEQYERVLVRALGGPTTEEERLRRRRQYQAEKTGEMCGKCGRDLLRHR